MISGAWDGLNAPAAAARSWTGTASRNFATDHGPAVLVQLGDLIVVHGVHRPPDALPRLVVALLLLADVDLDDRGTGGASLAIDEQGGILRRSPVAGDDPPVDLIAGGLAIAQEVGHLARLVPVVGQDEEDGLTRVAFVGELLLHLLPALDAGDQQVAVFLPGVGLPLAHRCLDVAGLLVPHLHPFQHRPLDDAVPDGVRQGVIDRRVLEEIRWFELFGSPGCTTGAALGRLGRAPRLGRRAGLLEQRRRQIDLQGHPPGSLALTVQASDRPDPGHGRCFVVGLADPGLVSRLLFELRVPGLIPDVVRLVVQDQQATRLREAIQQRRRHGFQPLGLAHLKQQLDLLLLPLPDGRRVLALAQQLMVVGDHQGALRGIQQARAGRRVVDLQVPHLVERGGHHGIAQEHGRLAIGRAEILKQPILNEQVRRDQDRVRTEPERTFGLFDRVQVGPGDEQAHHLGLARARGRRAFANCGDSVSTIWG